MPRFRATIIWLAAVFVVAGSAIGFANAGAEDVDEPKDPTELESPDLPDGADKDAIESVDRAEAERSGEAAAGERKQNHGFFVSQAAHCEDVDDPATPESSDFTAPEDCTGPAHGAYVSSVAKSSIGKKDKNKPENGS